MEKEIALGLVGDEHERAIGGFKPFHSPHEGLAIIQEEFEELKAAVFTKNRSTPSMQREATHLAAMALRFLVDIC